MENVLKLYINSNPVSLTPALQSRNGEALVPLHAFSEAVGAEVKPLEDGKKLAVCKGEICIPLDVSDENIVSIDGVFYASLAAFAEPLGLRWRIEDNALKVTSSDVENIGLGIGVRPPDFTLPDVYTGELVSREDYLGKKTVFFMWASW